MCCYVDLFMTWRESLYNFDDSGVVECHDEFRVYFRYKFVIVLARNVVWF